MTDLFFANLKLLRHASGRGSEILWLSPWEDRSEGVRSRFVIARVAG